MNRDGADRIEQRAAAWLLRQDEPGWGDADRAELEAWLDASPNHQAAYYRLEHAWREAGRMAALRLPAAPVASASAAIVAPRTSRNRRPLYAIAASLAVVVAAAGLFLIDGSPFARGTYVTDVGGRQTVPLADGSRLELNTDTRLRARIDHAERAVWLEKGEAYFEVAPDPERPFVVFAGVRKVTVLGTRFSVHRDGDQVQVAVVEGRVQVEAMDNSARAVPEILARGDIALAEGVSTLREASAERVERDLSWRHGMLAFDHITLAEAAAEFNRYNRRKLEVDDGVAAMRIAGSFEAGNIDAFTRLLRSAYGLQVTQADDRLVISQQ